MRWSIIRLIWSRELRDQLRDRRTVFMIVVLPILLYPAAGFGVMQLAIGFLNQKNIVGLAGAENLLPWHPEPADPSPIPAVSCLAFTPPPPGSPLIAGVERACLVAALVLEQPARDYPPLLEVSDGRYTFVDRYLEQGGAGQSLVLRPLEDPVPTTRDPKAFVAALDRRLLEQRKVDIILAVPNDFQQRLSRGERPSIFLIGREQDETARLVNLRVAGIIKRWEVDLKRVRLTRRGLPINFDEPIDLYDAARDRSPGKLEQESLFSVLIKVFPFVLVMWSLAGALYPAVDLCAGEKERGTMETLLISPASREEIVWGKFLTIWVFSGATALLNLLSMAITTWQFSSALPGAVFRPMALVWGVLLLLPLSAFFSALCLAVGAYARSSKEGQYYLMPLFLVTMPLIFLTLAPGVELNPFYSMVPVTGVALLLQKLMASGVDRGLWLYFIPVLAPMVLYSWLALRWAIGQFQREEVLFREAERLDLGLWLKQLLRSKEPLPTVGEAVFCFVIILGLRWISFGFGVHLSLLVRTAIGQLAFVAAPPLIMAVMLTTKPVQGMGLRVPPWWAWPAAVLLALLVVPPLAELTLAILRQFPALRALLELNHPLTRELRALSSGDSDVEPGVYFLVLALLPALCEELAFRGFILSGLRRGFRPWTAILLSAFLFALYQMNVFQFLPHFVFGVILALLVVRSGSVLPAMVFHLVYNTLVIAPSVLPGARELFDSLDPGSEGMGEVSIPRLLIAGVCALLAAGGVVAVWRLGQRGHSGEGVS